MEIEIQSLEELDPSKIYHIGLAADTSQETIQRFALAVKELGLRALITRAEVKFQAFEEMFAQLPEESKARLLELLQPPRPQFEINPVEHEQSK